MERKEKLHGRAAAGLASDSDRAAVALDDAVGALKLFEDS